MRASIAHTPNGAFISRDLYVGDMCIRADQMGANHWPGNLRPWSVWWGIIGGPVGATAAVIDDYGNLQAVQ